MATSNAQLITATGQPCLMAFDRTNPRAVDWARQRSAFLVKQVSAETRAAIRDIIARAMTEGMAPRQAARLIRDGVGLRRDQADAVANLLQRATDAGKRATRLGRPVTVHYGSSRVRVPPGGLPGTRLNRLLDRYSQRLRRQRSLMIARTETITASNQGQIELWRQARTTGLLRGDEQKQWSTTPDDRACPACIRLDGEKVDMDAQFDGGKFGSVDGPTLHPNCRCAVVLSVPSAASVRRAASEGSPRD